MLVIVLEHPPLYPLNLKLQDQPCVVVGGGEIAWRKTQSLLECGAHVRLVAPELHPELENLKTTGHFDHIPRPYQPGDLNGARLVVCATDDTEVNLQVFAEGQAQGSLVNVVDVPDLCDFYVPAVVRRGALQLTISTQGRCPGLSGHLRQQLETQFDPGWGNYVELLEEARQNLARLLPGPPGPRMRAMQQLLQIPIAIADLNHQEGQEQARQLLDKALAEIAPASI
ncbi:bifunctional precorrin-2 dehydrogenase/sirohydrochlorin ferrochelatase [bacterium]|nr:bifunctional precorrin-2 dehydrogenase/sirohydrochlorin ferrochelatase [bacterium]